MTLISAALTEVSQDTNNKKPSAALVVTFRFMMFPPDLPAPVQNTGRVCVTFVPG
jgi:hypothetical protein